MSVPDGALDYAVSPEGRLRVRVPEPAPEHIHVDTQYLEGEGLQLPPILVKLGYGFAHEPTPTIIGEPQVGFTLH